MVKDIDYIPSSLVLSQLLVSLKENTDNSIDNEEQVTSCVSPLLGLNESSKAFKYLKKNKLYSIALLGSNKSHRKYLFRAFNEESYVVAIRKDKSITELESLKLAIMEFVSGVRGTTFKNYVEFLDGTA